MDDIYCRKNICGLDNTLILKLQWVPSSRGRGRGREREKEKEREREGGEGEREREEWEEGGK